MSKAGGQAAQRRAVWQAVASDLERRGLSTRVIARQVGVGHSSVQHYLRQRRIRGDTDA